MLNFTALWLFYTPPGLTIKILYSAHTVHACALYVSRNKLLLFPYTALTGLCLQPRRRVFTVR